jgi:hypothetical protein
MPSSWLEEEADRDDRNDDGLLGTGSGNDDIDRVPDDTQHDGQTNLGANTTRNPPDVVNRGTSSGLQNLEYSPVVSDSPAASDGDDLQTRPSEVDSLFGDSQDGDFGADSMENAHPPDTDSNRNPTLEEEYEKLFAQEEQYQPMHPAPTEAFAERRETPGQSLPSDWSAADTEPVQVDENKQSDSANPLNPTSPAPKHTPNNYITSESGRQAPEGIPPHTTSTSEPSKTPPPSVPAPLKQTATGGGVLSDLFEENGWDSQVPASGSSGSFREAEELRRRNLGRPRDNLSSGSAKPPWYSVQMPGPSMPTTDPKFAQFEARSMRDRLAGTEVPQVSSPCLQQWWTRKECKATALC